MSIDVAAFAPGPCLLEHNEELIAEVNQVEVAEGVVLGQSQVAEGLARRKLAAESPRKSRKWADNLEAAVQSFLAAEASFGEPGLNLAVATHNRGLVAAEVASASGESVLSLQAAAILDVAAAEYGRLGRRQEHAEALTQSAYARFEADSPTFKAALSSAQRILEEAGSSLDAAHTKHVREWCHLDFLWRRVRDGGDLWKELDAGFEAIGQEALRLQSLFDEQAEGKAALQAKALAASARLGRAFSDTIAGLVKGTLEPALARALLVAEEMDKEDWSKDPGTPVYVASESFRGVFALSTALTLRCLDAARVWVQRDEESRRSFENARPVKRAKLELIAQVGGSAVWAPIAIDSAQREIGRGNVAEAEALLALVLAHEDRLSELDVFVGRKAVAEARRLLANLTVAADPCDEGRSSTGRRNQEIGQGAEAPTAPSVARDFAGASLGELEAALVPKVPASAVSQLEELIREAQQAAPEDREGFVRSVNRILDAQNLRLEVEGEEHLARLTIKNGSLALLVAGGRGSIGFRRRVSVVAVPESYALRGARPRINSDAPGL